LKVGEIEVPDNVRLVIGFPKHSHKEIEEIATIFKTANKNDFVFTDVRFEKVVETRDIVILNAFKKSR